MSKPQGIKGELFLSPLNPQADWPKNINSIKIGSQIFFLEKLTPHKKGFIIKIKDCRNKEQAELLRSQPVYLKKSIFTDKNSLYLSELIGFSIFFEGEKGFARVASFRSQAKAPDTLIAVFEDQKQCSVPFIQEYIKKIDKKNKQIHLKLPMNFLETFKE